MTQFLATYDLSSTNNQSYQFSSEIHFSTERGQRLSRETSAIFEGQELRLRESANRLIGTRQRKTNPFT